MDARSLLAVLAVIFLLWLVRAWAQWDSQEKMARESRDRLRNRLADSSFQERIIAGDSTRVPVSATTAPIDSEPVEVTQDSVSTLKRLQAQLEQAEARAKSAEQNDLELRRLRSELASIKLEKSNAAKLIVVLEKRLREQQEALSKIAPARVKKQSPTPAEKVITPLYTRPEQRDNLKKIRGIGPVMERTLNQLGVTTFHQLASFTQTDIAKVSEAIGAFPGRIERDDWVGAARKLEQENNPV